jgi:hypothetical protein
MFSSLFLNGIALGAKVKAAVEAKAAVGVNVTIKVKSSVLDINATVEVNTTIKPVFSEKHSCQCLRERMLRRMIW